MLPDETLPSLMRVAQSEAPMCIALVYGRQPLPMTRADQMTVAHLISFLSTRGHTIDLFTLDSGGAKPSPAQAAWLAEKCREVNIVNHSPLRRALGAISALFAGIPLQIGWFTNQVQQREIRKAIKKRRYDVVYTYYARSAESTRSLVNGGRSSSLPVTYLAMQLSQALNTKRIFERATNFRDKIIYGYEHRTMRQYESTVWQDFTRTVLIGESDVREIRNACREYGVPEINNYLICAHGVDIDRFRHRVGTEETNTLVFSGVMGTNTNIEAITWFVNHCWDEVKGAVPGVKLLIVGRNPPPSIIEFARHDKQITVTGEVADPATYIAKATVCINPMQAGAGMQNKLIEYLASSKAVVATTVANEGVGAVPGEHLLIADDPKEFSEFTIELLCDRQRADALGRRARAYIEERWTWSHFFLELEADMENTIRHQNRERELAPE